MSQQRSIDGYLLAIYWINNFVGATIQHRQTRHWGTLNIVLIMKQQH